MVTLGPQGENDMYQVLDGLKEGERIVTSGQFLLDAESQLRAAIQEMLKPSQPQPETNMTMPTPRAVVTTNATALPAQDTGVKYICPMPEHVSIEYNHPGKCPICGMTLVPVTAATLAKLQPGGKLLYYTCPMPEHSDVHEDKPGKCPKCGMTLIPVMEVQPIPPPAATTNTTAIPSPLYTCSMHLDVVSDKPGKCPKCGMDLVPAGSLPNGKVAEENWLKQHPSTARPAVDHQP